MSQDQSDREASRTSERSTYLSKNGYGLDFPRGRTALLVIDPVNDFLSEGGAAWDLNTRIPSTDPSAS